MPLPLSLFRRAEVDDAERIAALHADSWRRHTRGAYADSFLDGDVLGNRRLVWRARLTEPGGTETILAEDGDRLVGFVHVVFDRDPRWGSLVDNLHVVDDRKRSGVGTRLLAHGARAVTGRAAARAAGRAMYLWVLEQNTAAQRFYLACGATSAETAAVPPPGGDPTRLHGSPRMRRMVWPDAAHLSRYPCDAPGATGPLPSTG